MIDQVTLGNRIKFFRERAKLSQFDLENSIGASNGALSRIEKGKVNPTKETVRSLGKFLKLTDRELSYLIGNLALPVSGEMLHNVKRDIETYFNKKEVLAYLLDDRYRMVAMSKTFAKFIHWDEEILKDSFLKSFVNIVIENKFKIPSTFNKEEYLDTITNVLQRYYNEMNFMVDDPSYQEAMRVIEMSPLASKVWEEITANPPGFFNTLNSRKVNFSFMGISIPLIYSVEPLSSNNRFELIEYEPTSRFVKNVMKFLQLI